MSDSAYRPRHTILSHGSWFLSLLATLIIPLVGMVAGAQEASNGAIQSLDEQVQEIKTDILAIAAELNNLEEKLLYPSNTQLAIFVSLEEGDSLGLDSVQVSIDGELVAQHLYSFKELQALRKGGVQRIYTGNVRTGEHQLEVSIAAKTAGGKDIGHRQGFVFSKEVDPKLVGITLASGAMGEATIAVGGW
ncbi:unnamed protein product [marine sediment metagenome]|uniref:AraC family transcriptional regulator n=1 Tax=marine sediment metagenome TaxID=412755 RepID=X0S9K0_9ZZZZ